MLKRLSLLTPLILASVLMAARCGDDPDESALVGGEVVPDSVSYEALDYEISSDRYNKWLRAQAALDSVGVDATERVDVRNVSDSDVDRVVRSLDTQANAKAAIESADMSVRDFVLTTVALAQSWDAVNRPGTRVVGIRPTNIDFLRTRQGSDAVTRPTRFVRDDSDSDSDSDGRDSDSDGNRGRGKDKDKRDKPGKGRGRD